jgi:hypothetical protein
MVLLLNRGPLQLLGLRVRKILHNKPDGQMDVPSFLREYKKAFNVSCSLELIRRDLFNIVTVNIFSLSLSAAPLISFLIKCFD